jgi:predicted nucleotidyltransferase
MTAEAEEYRRKLREMLPELAERFGVAELGLFGSRVRGDHRPDSDLDVLVSFAPDASLSLLDVVELEYLLSDRLGLKVDLALKRSLKPRLRPYILQEVQTV